MRRVTLVAAVALALLVAVGTVVLRSVAPPRVGATAHMGVASSRLLVTTDVRAVVRLVPQSIDARSVALSGLGQSRLLQTRAARRAGLAPDRLRIAPATRGNAFHAARGGAGYEITPVSPQPVLEVNAWAPTAAAASRLAAAVGAELSATAGPGRMGAPVVGAIGPPVAGDLRYGPRWGAAIAAGAATALVVGLLGWIGAAYLSAGGHGVVRGWVSST